MRARRSTTAHQGVRLRTGREGFAAVDALVALMILSATIILSLGAAEVGRRAMRDAVQVRRADQILLGLLKTTPHEIGAVQGRSSNFVWRVTTKPANAAARSRTTQICERVAKVQALGDHRRYSMSTAELCPTPT